MFLTISDKGYYIGFTESAAMGKGRKLARSPKVFSCSSLQDAENIIRSFMQYKHVHEYPIVADSIVLFKPVQTCLKFRNGVNDCYLFDDLGMIQYRSHGETVWKVRVDPVSLQPDTVGIEILDRDGYLPYYDFIEGKELKLVRYGKGYRTIPYGDELKKNVGAGIYNTHKDNY